MTKQKWSKALFAVKVVNLLPKIRLILNLDEVCLTRNLKQQYSWIERGQSKWIRNSQFTDMIAIISTIFSWGTSFNGVFLWTINGELVKNYIENLISFISKRVDVKLSEVLLVLDNCPKHKWKQVSKFLREWGMNIVFLPGYAPELAPIEIMFKNLKSRVRSSKEKGYSKLISQNGTKTITSILRRISPVEVQKWWQQFYKEIQNNLCFVRQEC